MIGRRKEEVKAIVGDREEDEEGKGIVEEIVIGESQESPFTESILVITKKIVIREMPKNLLIRIYKKWNATTKVAPPRNISKYTNMSARNIRLSDMSCLS